MQELAQSLVAFPQQCLRGDRQSCYEQWNQPLHEAIPGEAPGCHRERERGVPQPTRRGGRAQHIAQVDGAPVGDGEVGPITRALWKGYWDAHYDPRLSFGINYY